MIFSAIAAGALALQVTPVAASEATPAQTNSRCDPVITINAIDVQSGMSLAAREYYRSAWLAAREVALERGYIANFELLSSQRGESEHPEIILITRYANRAQYDAAEERFRAIFRELELPRPLLIDGLERSEIVGPVIGADDYRIVFSSEGPCQIPGHSIAHSK